MVLYKEIEISVAIAFATYIEYVIVRQTKASYQALPTS